MTLSLQPWLGLSRKICKVALEIFSPEFWEKVPGLQEMCFILKWPHRREKRSGAAKSLRWRRQPSAQWRRDLEQWLEMMERVDQQTFSLYKYRSPSKSVGLIGYCLFTEMVDLENAGVVA